MTEAALSHGAINLAQGFPNFDGPETIKERAIAAIRNGMNQYAPSVGPLGLRQLLAQHQEKRCGLRYDPATEVTVFSGATEAIFCAIMTLLDPGDEVLTFAPHYDSYPAAALAAGAAIKCVNLEPPHWDLREEAIRAQLSERTRALIVNSPHNPSGRVLSHAELEAIATVARERDLLVITDEVYEHIVYDNAEHLFLAAFEGMRERTVMVSSTSKTYSLTGWKVGYAFAPAALSRNMRALHQYTVFCSATPLLEGMCAAFELGQEYYEKLRADYSERRDFLFDSLVRCGFQCVRPQGTYFILADYSRLSDLDDEAFCLWLTREAKVAAIPMSAFFARQDGSCERWRYLRFAFAKDMATLREAVDRLETFFGVARGSL